MKKVNRRAGMSRAALVYLKPFLITVVLACGALIIHEYLRPSLLLVGNVTIDLVDKKAVLVRPYDLVVVLYSQKCTEYLATGQGGAVSYAAAVASAFGVRACIVTAAGDDVDLSGLQGHELHVVHSNATLTFEHTYTWWGNNRKLRVVAHPNVTLRMADVPLHCRRARTMLLGPLTSQDIDIASFINYRQGKMDRWLGFQQHVGLMAQGLQRSLDSNSKVVALKEPAASLRIALGPHVNVFLSDVETLAWSPGKVEELAEISGRWLVTKGELGADEYGPHGALTPIPPVKVDAVDTNGAGDTFATAYMLAVASHVRSPGAFASWAASRAVMQPQACKPQCVRDALRRDSLSARVFSWLLSRARAATLQAQAIWQRLAGCVACCSRLAREWLESARVAHAANIGQALLSRLGWPGREGAN